MNQYTISNYNGIYFLRLNEVNSFFIPPHHFLPLLTCTSTCVVMATAISPYSPKLRQRIDAFSTELGFIYILQFKIITDHVDFFFWQNGRITVAIKIFLALTPSCNPNPLTLFVYVQEFAPGHAQRRLIRLQSNQ